MHSAPIVVLNLTWYAECPSVTLNTGLNLKFGGECPEFESQIWCLNVLLARYGRIHIFQTWYLCTIEKKEKKKKKKLLLAGFEHESFDLMLATLPFILVTSNFQIDSFLLFFYLHMVPPPTIFFSEKKSHFFFFRKKNLIFFLKNFSGGIQADLKKVYWCVIIHSSSEWGFVHKIQHSASCCLQQCWIYALIIIMMMNAPNDDEDDDDDDDILDAECTQHLAPNGC